MGKTVSGGDGLRVPTLVEAEAPGSQVVPPGRPQAPPRECRNWTRVALTQAGCGLEEGASQGGGRRAALPSSDTSWPGGAGPAKASSGRTHAESPRPRPHQMHEPTSLHSHASRLEGVECPNVAKLRGASQPLPPGVHGKWSPPSAQAKAHRVPQSGHQGGSPVAPVDPAAEQPWTNEEDQDHRTMITQASKSPVESPAPTAIPSENEENNLVRGKAPGGLHSPG